MSEGHDRITIPVHPEIVARFGENVAAVAARLGAALAALIEEVKDMPPRAFRQYLAALRGRYHGKRKREKAFRRAFRLAAAGL